MYMNIYIYIYIHLYIHLHDQFPNTFQIQNNSYFRSTCVLGDKSSDSPPRSTRHICNSMMSRTMLQGGQLLVPPANTKWSMLEFLDRIVLKILKMILYTTYTLICLSILYPPFPLKGSCTSKLCLPRHWNSQLPFDPLNGSMVNRLIH